ncbi:M13 family metallopeptidase [Luteibacter sp. CQ10]|uniref:M13 family metallopeptidase n=1 Tax=Luteibacter sp. CQ10 TaxID=2805821 RepID=UPI0034A25A2A
MKPSRALLLVGVLACHAHAHAAEPTSPTPSLPVPAAPATKPGDDFDRFVNGTWADSHPMPGDRGWIGTWPELQARAEAQSRELVERAVQDGSPMGRLYASALNQEARDRRGMAPLRATLAEIDAVHDAESLVVMLARLARIDVGAVVIPMIGEDDRAPGQRLLAVRQAKVGLPNPADYTVADGPGVARRDAYRRFLAALLEASGAPRERIKPRVDAVLQLEGRLAAAQTSLADQRDAMAGYRPADVHALGQRLPQFAWGRWLAALGATGVQRVNVPFQQALAAQWAIVRRAPLDVVRDFLILKTLGAYSRYMSGPLAAARFAYYGTALRGVTVEPPAWRQGMDRVTNLMPEALGRAYAARYFSPAAKTQAVALAEAVRRALAGRVARATWLSVAAREGVQAKLMRTRLSIGYPEVWPDVPDVDIREDDLAGNVLRLNAWRFDRAIGDLALPIDRASWTSPVQVPNAYASASANHIVFPAALLQPPMFDPAATAAENYGRIGATIGHELSHLFDDQGRHYDADGRLRETWTSDDVQRFDARAGALQKQLEGYAPLPGERVDGSLVLGESVADLAGLEAAYDAFVQAEPGSGHARRASDRRFFVAWAELWRSRYQPAYLRTLLHTDAHPPGSVRLSTVRNLDAWYEAFAVPSNAALYLAPEARVRMW